MNSRYLASKLFLGLAALLVLRGIILFGRGAIGSGLTGEDYLNPIFWVTIPKLSSLTAAILSAFFGLVYYALAKRFKSPGNTLLVLVHLASYSLAVLGFAAVESFWWSVPNEEHATISLQLSASMFLIVGAALCCAAFGVNIYRSVSSGPRSSQAN